MVFKFLEFNKPPRVGRGFAPLASSRTSIRFYINRVEFRGAAISPQRRQYIISTRRAIETKGAQIFQRVKRIKIEEYQFCID